MLNHIQVLGMAFGIALIAWALIKRNEDKEGEPGRLCRVVALLAIPV